MTNTDWREENPLRPPSQFQKLLAVIQQHFPLIATADAKEWADEFDEHACVLLTRAGFARVRKVRGRTDIVFSEKRKGKTSATKGLQQLANAINRGDKYGVFKATIELNEPASVALKTAMTNEYGFIWLDQPVSADDVSKALLLAKKRRRPPAGILDHVARKFVRLWRWLSGRHAAEPSHLEREGKRKGSMVAFVNDCMRVYKLPAPGSGSSSWARILRDD